MVPDSSGCSRRSRRPARPDAAEAASLLRAHDRLGDRRRGRAAGCADQGGGIVRHRRPDRQSRRLAVPDRAQHRAGFPAPSPPAGSAAIGRGDGHDRRPDGCRRQPPDRGRKPSHLHAAAGRPALQRDPDGCARLLAAAKSARSWISACRRSRPRCIAGARGCANWPTSRTICRWQNCRTPTATGLAPMSRISTRAISTRSAP